MTVETDMLASLDQSAHFAMTSPFSFAQSLPTQPTFDHYLDPHSSSPHVNSFHPGSVFDKFKFGLSNDNPEPPINLSANERVRSQSASRSSHIGKAPTARSRPTRKLSLSEARPPSAGLQQRGRSVQSARTQTMSNHPRTMSQSDVFAGRLGLGIGLDTHKEGERTDSVTPPDFGLNGTYGVSIPRNQAGDAASWGSAGSAPSLLPGSIGSYGGNNDEAITER